jgi:hypothetical protein
MERTCRFCDDLPYQYQGPQVRIRINLTRKAKVNEGPIPLGLPTIRIITYLETPG